MISALTTSVRFLFYIYSFTFRIKSIIICHLHCLLLLYYIIIKRLTIYLIALSPCSTLVLLPNSIMSFAIYLSLCDVSFLYPVSIVHYSTIKVSVDNIATETTRKMIKWVLCIPTIRYTRANNTTLTMRKGKNEGNVKVFLLLSFHTCTGIWMNILTDYCFSLSFNFPVAIVLTIYTHSSLIALLTCKHQFNIKGTG